MKNKNAVKSWLPSFWILLGLAGSIIPLILLIGSTIQSEGLIIK